MNDLKLTYVPTDSLIPYAGNARKPPKNKESWKARSDFATTAVYHLSGRFGRQSRAISRRPKALMVGRTKHRSGPPRGIGEESRCRIPGGSRSPDAGP